MTGFHVNVGAIETLVAALDGLARVGTPGAAMIVVKLHDDEYGLLPPELVALTLQ